MAFTHLSASDSKLLAIPLEIRRCIYGFCIPQHLTFDFSDDMYYQNRSIDWIEPPWHSNEGCDAGSEEAFISELHALQNEWRSMDESFLLGAAEVASVDEDSLDRGTKEDSESLESDRYDFTPPSSDRSALPALLLLCRQINDEVETMLYGGNTFTVSVHDQGEYHTKRQFTPWKRERMRNIILVLRPINVPYQPKSLMDPEIWDAVLGNLLTLGVIVEQSEPPLLEWLEDSEKEAPGNFLAFLQDKRREAAAEWMTWLLPVFEYLVRVIPKQTEIVVDVAEEEDTVQALEFFQKGPFRFQKLPAADNRLEFAWEGEGYDDGPTSCRDIINDSDYDYYYSD